MSRTAIVGFLLAYPDLIQFIHIPLLHQIQSYALLPNQHHNRPALHSGGNWNMATHWVTLPGRVLPDCNGYNQYVWPNRSRLSSDVPKNDVARVLVHLY